MGRFQKKSNSSLSIQNLLEKSAEKNVIDLREKRLEWSGFTTWKIWKVLHINWR